MVVGTTTGGQRKGGADGNGERKTAKNDVVHARPFNGGEAKN